MIRPLINEIHAARSGGQEGRLLGGRRSPPAQDVPHEGVDGLGVGLPVGEVVLDVRRILEADGRHQLAHAPTVPGEALHVLSEDQLVGGGVEEEVCAGVGGGDVVKLGQGVEGLGPEGGHGLQEHLDQPPGCHDHGQRQGDGRRQPRPQRPRA